MMLTEPERFSQVRWLHVLVCVLAILGGGALIGFGVMGGDSPDRLWAAVAGAFMLLLAITLMTLMTLVVKIEWTTARQLGELRHIKEGMQKQVSALNSISENTRITDAAKSLAHREDQVEIMRRAIREDVSKGRWEAGLALIKEIEERLGYSEEAQELLTELNAAQRKALESQLGKAIQAIEAHFRQHNWELAASEIDRIMKALPGDDKVASLLGRMEALKTQHKQELKRAWDEAVRRSDTDLAIDILRELDQYLSSAEAAELQNSARDVFKEKLLQLGVQFRFAVTERRWHDALTAGLELVQSFPNARMANEVREALDTLRERARDEAGGQPASTIQG
jgi:tetratricopeptide (TPR) repeat protein